MTTRTGGAARHATTPWGVVSLGDRVDPQDVTLSPTNYPSNMEAEVATRDGSLVRIRPVLSDDTSRLQSISRSVAAGGSLSAILLVWQQLGSHGARRDECRLHHVTWAAGDCRARSAHRRTWAVCAGQSAVRRSGLCHRP